MKKKLSHKQWIGAVILLLLFIFLTLFIYSRTHEDARFEKFVNRFFLSELCINPVNLHYTLADASAYGIDESSLTLPVYHANQAVEDAGKAGEALASLRRFRPQKMSADNQYTYVLLSTYLAAQEACSPYPYFDEPLSPSSGVQSGLPILLAEYRLSSVADIQNYLSILSQIPSYLEGIALYEREKAEHNLFMPDTSADKIIEQCTILMNPQQLADGEHFLEITFAQRLERLVSQGVIDREDADAWQSENMRLLATVVAPAYDRLADELTLLKGSGADVQGLSKYDGGQEYYRAYLRTATGSYRSVPEIKAMLVKDFEQNYTALLTLLQEYPALTDALAAEDTFFPAFSPEDMLIRLQEMIKEDFPSIQEEKEEKKETVTCTVKHVDDCLEPYSAPAFYLTPPIDDIRENTIYLNDLHTDDGLALFTTLAHEGYPGHLYQTVYSGYCLQEAGGIPLRQVLYYGGYIEGWAMYVELCSYDYAIRLTQDAHPETKSLYPAEKLNRKIQLCLYSLLDILIHDEGASYEKVSAILSAIGFTSEESIRAVYEYIAEEPCNYLKYYLGYLEIEALKKQAETVWGDSFTLYRFHTFLLSNGPADFRTLGRLLNLNEQSQRQRQSVFPAGKEKPVHSAQGFLQYQFFFF